MRKIPQLMMMILVIYSSLCQYSTQLAKDMAYLSSISYQSQQNINEWNCQLCLKYSVKDQQLFFSQDADIQGYGVFDIKNNAIVIAFRGTVDLKNWLFNLQTFKTKYANCIDCQVHLGFSKAYQGVAPLVKPIVENLFKLHSGVKLMITGHSLGGAMAVLCGLDLKKIYGKIDELYTFGQPRVGNKKFAKYLQGQIQNLYRIINYADVVPHAPPSALTFRHGGHEIWYNPRGMNSFNTCVSEDKMCTNSISILSMSSEDHSLNMYLNLHIINDTVQAIAKNTLGAVIYTDQQISKIQLRKFNQIVGLIGEQIRLSSGRLRGLFN